MGLGPGVMRLSSLLQKVSNMGLISSTACSYPFVFSATCKLQWFGVADVCVRIHIRTYIYIYVYTHIHIIH